MQFANKMPNKVQFSNIYTPKYNYAYSRINFVLQACIQQQ